MISLPQKEEGRRRDTILEFAAPVTTPKWILHTAPGSSPEISPFTEYLYPMRLPLVNSAVHGALTSERSPDIQVPWGVSHMRKTVQLIHALLITRDQALVEQVERDLSLVANISFTVNHLQELPAAATPLVDTAQVVLLDLPLVCEAPWEPLERTMRRLPGVPVVVLARDSDYALALEALRQGAQDFLLIPALTQRPLVLAMLGAVDRTPARGSSTVGDVKTQADQEWKATFDAVEDVIVVLGKDRKVQRANRAAERLFGVESLYKERCHTLFHGTDAPLHGCTVDRTFRTGGASHLEFKEEHLGGRWFSMSAYPIKRASGEVERVVHVLRDVTESKKSEHYQRILDAKRLVLTELEELNEMKSQFIEVSAHEMRTPMTVIRSGVDLLLGGNMGPLNERQTEFMRIVERNIDRLSRFATDVLSLARLDAGRYPLTLKPLDLAKSLKPTLDMLEVTAKEKQITLSWSLNDEQVPRVYADADALAQVLFNLLSNAVMHCTPGTQVQVRARLLSEEEVELSVEDNGPGIPDGQLPRIFDRFYQVDRKDGPGYGGTGIGLTICKALVEKMGGALSVRSARDTGTTFSFSLPTRQRPREILFGRIARSLGLVTPEQVQGIVDAQIKDQADKKIGQLMEDAGLLTAQQVETILRLQHQNLTRPHPNLSSTVGEALMGHLAVKHGYITEEQLHECVALQSMHGEDDKYVRLGQVLLEKGYMTLQDIVMVLKMQKKRMASCPGCGGRFTLPDILAGSAVCPNCGAPLKADLAMEELEDIEVDGDL